MNHLLDTFATALLLRYLQDLARDDREDSRYKIAELGLNMLVNVEDNPEAFHNLAPEMRIAENMAFTAGLSEVKIRILLGCAIDRLNQLKLAGVDVQRFDGQPLPDLQPGKQS